MQVRFSWFALFVAAAWACSEDSTAPAPAVPRSGQIVALTNAGTIFWVDPAVPDVILGVVAPQGMHSGDTLVTLAQRPATGQFYARADAGTLWVVDLATGVATQVGGASFSFGAVSVEATAFSPLADRLRYVNNARDNVRFNPVTGVPVVDDTLGTAAVIAAIAYTPPSAGNSTLYGLDRTNKQLVRIGGVGGLPSPNLGGVTAIGPLNVGPAAIVRQGLAITGGGQAYAAVGMTDDFTTRLWSVDLASGAATLVGPLGTGSPVVALTAVP